VSNNDNRPPADRLIERLDGVRTKGKRAWIAKCPAHQDRSPSLSVREADDGRVLIHCFAGCPVHDVNDAVGLDMADLFPPQPEDHKAISASQRWIPRQVLEAVARESMIVAIAAEDIAGGKLLSLSDTQRVGEAALVLQDAARQAGYIK